MAGRTDAWILNDAVAAHGLPLDLPHLAQFREVYVRHLAIELEKPVSTRKGLMPGVRELLDSLAARDDVYLALLTGNYEAGARLKLEYFDLWRYFACGAFGDDAPHRNVLVPKALARVEACGGLTFAPGDTVVIGDTPLDVACAAHVGGALARASPQAATRSRNYVPPELTPCSKDLSDIEEVGRMLGIRK